MDYATAVELLRSPQTWCEGAETLAQLGDAHALLPLMRAYEMRYEGSKVCLLEAMRALAAEQGAQQLFDAAASLDERRLAIHLMELFPDAQHLARLEQAVNTSDSALRYQAARSLVCQKQTEAWEQTMRRLLDDPDERLRSWAIEGLGYCRRDSARQALREHLLSEPSAALRQKLEKLLAAPR
jgi:HEAT repeat protein